MPNYKIETFPQGVGVSLMLVQGMSGVYSIVITSWMFVYFRDSFITIHQPYKWSRCEKDVPAFENLRHCHQQNANQNWSLQQVTENVLLLDSPCPYVRSFVGHKWSLNSKSEPKGPPDF